MIIYYLECKKGCNINYTVETDIKDLPKKMKLKCPKCNRRIYQNDNLTKFVGPKKSVPKYRKKKTTMEQEVENRKKHKKRKR